MKTKYFELVYGRWVFHYKTSYAEDWEIVVWEEGIEINRISEHHGGIYSHPELPEILEEALSLYKAYRHGTRI